MLCWDTFAQKERTSYNVDFSFFFFHNVLCMSYICLSILCFLIRILVHQHENLEEEKLAKMSVLFVASVE